MKIRRWIAVAAISVMVSFGVPAYAHDYPDPGGHNWQLVKEEKVRAFVAKNAAEELTREQLSHKRTGREERNRNTKDDPAYEVPPTSKDVRLGTKTRSRKSEGRFINTYEHQPYDHYIIHKLETPVFEHWEERPTYTNIDRVTRKISWREPVTNAVKSTEKTAIETYAAKGGDDEWAAKKGAKSVALKKSTKDEFEKTTIATKRIGSIVGSAGAITEAQQGADARNLALTGDTGKGAAGGAQSSSGASQRLARAGQARASGGPAGLSLEDYDQLLAKAKTRPDLYLGSQKGPSWQLSASGRDVIFTPYGPSGPAGAGITLGPGKLSGANQFGDVRVDGISTSGDFVVIGSFKNNLLENDASQLTVR